MSPRETAPSRTSHARADDYCARRVCGVVVAALFLLSCSIFKAQVLPATDPIKPDPNAITRRLERGINVEGDLTRGGTREYFVNLQADEFARIIVEQRGIDIVLKVFSADNTLLARTNDVEEPAGSEQVVVLAEVSGVYRVEIHGAEESEAGRYVVRLAELRAATPQDRQFIAAGRTLLEANRLLSEKTAESRRLAIKKFAIGPEIQPTLEQWGSVAQELPLPKGTPPQIQSRGPSKKFGEDEKDETHTSIALAPGVYGMACFRAADFSRWRCCGNRGRRSGDD